MRNSFRAAWNKNELVTSYTLLQLLRTSKPRQVKASKQARRQKIFNTILTARLGIGFKTCHGLGFLRNIKAKRTLECINKNQILCFKSSITFCGPYPSIICIGMERGTIITKNKTKAVVQGRFNFDLIHLT